MNVTPAAPRPDLDEAVDLAEAARRICAALDVDVCEDGWADECVAALARLQAAAENAHAEAVARQATLRGLSVEEGAAVLELGPPRELVIAWVHAAREMLAEAPNYSESRVDFPVASMEVKAAGEFERYVFTVQRAGKVTPHEARRAAEAERDEARAALAGAQAELDRLREIEQRARAVFEYEDVVDPVPGGVWAALRDALGEA